MWLQTAVKYWSLTWSIKKVGVLSAMEYRFSFVTKILGMVLNDAGFMLVWLFFFSRFTSLNGWHFADMALLFACTTSVFAITMFLGGGARMLSRWVANGELDYFLSSPKNVLWQVSVSSLEISDLGDLVFGLIMLVVSGNLSVSRVAIFVSVVTLASVLFWAAMVVFNSLTFFWGNFEDGAAQLVDGLLGFSLYPQNIFSGGLKILMLTVLPAFLMCTLPVDLLRDFSWQGLGTLALGVGVWVIIAIFIFYRGLRRYSSGNLIGVRM